MRKNILLALLIIGTIAGYANGIYSVTHRADRGSCEHSRWHDRNDDTDRK